MDGRANVGRGSGALCAEADKRELVAEWSDGVGEAAEAAEATEEAEEAEAGEEGTDSG